MYKRQQLPGQRQDLRHRLQGNGIDYHPNPEIFLQNTAEDSGHGPAGTAQKHMGGRGQLLQRLRRTTGDYGYVSRRKPAAILRD